MAKRCKSFLFVATQEPPALRAHLRAEDGAAATAAAPRSAFGAGGAAGLCGVRQERLEALKGSRKEVEKKLKTS